jgi:hypothetical protein
MKAGRRGRDGEGDEEGAGVREGKKKGAVDEQEVDEIGPVHLAVCQELQNHR